MGNKAIGGAVRALEKLRDSGVKLQFVTNTTKESRRKLLARLHGLGFDVREEEVTDLSLRVCGLCVRVSMRARMIES